MTPGRHRLARLAPGRHRLARLALAAGTAVVVYVLATQVFPYHTTNHDEAVYLQQAALLLDGQFFLDPPVVDAFRPWFFVEDGGRLYPKYAPVVAGMFATGILLGSERIALALVAAGVVWLTAVVVAEAFDRPTGLTAAALLAASPLFLVQSSVFLPYVPTTLWNLAFAAAYLHADRTGDRRSATLAGVAVGIAFFARPYTAVLFAAPFVAHALWTLRERDRETVVRQGCTAAAGLVGVAVALGYNAVVTGSPLLFPYEAFAPADGLGFGHREILGYSREYTPALAVRANAELLWLFLTEWFVAGPLGTLVAIAGLAAIVRRRPTARQAAVLGVFVSVAVGNLYFWGTVNVLGDLGNPNDGLVGFLGPFYHVDLLLPSSALAAVGVRAAWRVSRRVVDEYAPASHRRPVILAIVLVGGTVFAGATVTAAASPVAANAVVTDQLETAYEPFEARDIDGAVVFLPTPYGEWLHHPFQALRNDPDFDGKTVYALREDQFAVVDAYPDRSLYRYAYHGRWRPYVGESVVPRLQPVDVTEGERISIDVRAAVPRSAASVSIRLDGADTSAYGTVPEPTDPLALTMDVSSQAATLRGPGLSDEPAVPIAGDGSLELWLFVDYGTGAGTTYRVVLPVDETEGGDGDGDGDGSGVRVLTPYLETCTDARLCGGEGAYVPDQHDPDRTITATVERGMSGNETAR